MRDKITFILPNKKQLLVNIYDLKSKEYIIVNNKLYNFPIYKSIKYITKEACLRFALSATRTYGDAASFLGINESDLRKEMKIQSYAVLFGGFRVASKIPKVITPIVFY